MSQFGLDFLQEDRLERPREACGVFGIFGKFVDVARLTFFSLYALQHRGQESAGIATCDGRVAYIHKGMGLVSQVFDEDNLRPLKGHLAIGQNRYSTTGSSHLRNAQPYLIETQYGPLGVGHNGNLTNAVTLREKLLERGVGLISSSDSEVITQMLAAPVPGNNDPGPNWAGRLKAFMAEAEGAYSLVILTREAIYAVRDPLGLRPLCIGKLSNDGPSENAFLGETTSDKVPLGYVVASESCALGTIGADYVREVQPGEIIRLDENGIHSIQGGKTFPQAALCVFEFVYFSRPDSVLEGQTIHRVRQRLGEVLAREQPAEADLVIGVPDSAIPAAIGYAMALGIPYSEGLTKNRYIGRTFIQPDDRLRRSGVRLKYNPLTANLAGKRIVLVDDSVVRGNTAGPLVKLLRDGGAAEVHMRVSSPPIRHPCFMGLDMATHEELIAYSRSVEEIRNHIQADSLGYLSVEGMMQAVDGLGVAQHSHCGACFTGNYPIQLDEWWHYKAHEKQAFESIWG